MKLERRGKYPGVKVHLEPDECDAFMRFAEDVGKSTLDIPSTSVLKQDTFFSVSLKIGKKMLKLANEHPDMLDERTPEQIEAALLADKEKIEKQLAAGVGTDAWQMVK